MIAQVCLGIVGGYAAFGLLLMVWCRAQRRMPVGRLVVGVLAWPVILAFMLLRAYKVANR